MHEEDAALRRLLDLASHQLKNPLQAIVVNAEVVRIRVSREVPELWSALERHAAAIESNVRVLDRRLQLLVMLARADGEPETAVQPVRLCADLVETAHFDVGPVPVVVESGDTATAGRARAGHLVRFFLTTLERARVGEGGEVRVRAGAGEGEAGEGGGPWIEVVRTEGSAPRPFGGKDWNRMRALAREAGVDELRVDANGASLHLRLPAA